MKQTIALFGESEKGSFQTPYHLHHLPQVMDLLGHPPPESEGLFFAIQAVLYNRQLIFFRVPEEGFSQAEYFHGLSYLKNHQAPLSALCLPGVGDPEILRATERLCHTHKSLLITRHKDLQDYLTS